MTFLSRTWLSQKLEKYEEECRGMSSSNRSLEFFRIIRLGLFGLLALSILSLAGIGFAASLINAASWIWVIVGVLLIVVILSVLIRAVFMWIAFYVIFLKSR